MTSLRHRRRGRSRARTGLIGVALAALAASLSASASGCELVAGVDRTMIPGAGGSGGAGGAGGASGVTSTVSSTATAPPEGSSFAASSTSSSGACQGSMAHCLSPGDCPIPQNDCVERECNNGCCTVFISGIGKKCGSNGGTVCDGTGLCVGCVSFSDCHSTGTVCATETCTGHQCALTVAKLGTPCSENGGVVCDGFGVCVAEHCNDGVFDGDETDKDCGGSCALKCPNLAHCVVDGDCASNLCLGNNPGTCVACKQPSDCPATGSECVVATCVSNACGTQNLDASHALSSGQTSGDCQKVVCDGAGGVKSIDDPTDLPLPTTACGVPTCAGSPSAPSFTPAPTGTDCSADNHPPKHVCGDTATPLAGLCVQCNVASDCLAIDDAGVLACVNGVCQ